MKKSFLTFIIALYSLTLWSAPVPAILGTVDSQMAVYLNLDQSHSHEDSLKAFELLKSQGLIPEAASGSFSELTVLQHWAQSGNVGAFKLGAQLFVQELNSPQYPGMVGIYGGIRAVYAFAYARDRKAEADKSFMELVEKIFEVKRDFAAMGLFNYHIETPEGVKLLVDVVDPQLIYEFYLKRLREKSHDYSGFAINYLLEKNRERAFNDIPSVILESLKEGKNSFAEKIFEQVRKYTRGVANRSLGVGSPDKEIYEFLRWLKKLSLTLPSSEVKTQVDLARVDLQGQIKSHVQTEKLLANNPALQDEIAAKFNNLFGAYRPIRCQEILNLDNSPKK